MYGLALCLPSMGQPQGLPVPHEISKTLNNCLKVFSRNPTANPAPGVGYLSEGGFLGRRSQKTALYMEGLALCLSY